MASLNKTMLIGRLTQDPEAPRTLPNSGSTVVKFRLAVGRSRKNPQTGQWENDPHPLYIDCEVFTRSDAKRNLCDLVSRYVKRGDQLYLEGRLQLDEWEDKNGGGKRSKHKIVVDSIELLGGGAGKAGPAQEDGGEGDGYAAGHGTDDDGAEEGTEAAPAPVKQAPPKATKVPAKGGAKKGKAAMAADDEADPDIPF